MALNLNVMVGGEAGQGVQSVGAMMAKGFFAWRVPHLRRPGL